MGNNFSTKNIKMSDQITDSENQNTFWETKTLSNKINQRSEIVQEIISREPSFIEKWSLYIFMGILALLLIMTWFVKYPDTIETRAILTAINAPKEIITRQDGRLVKLFFHNNEKISKGEILGWIECTANHQDVLKLSHQVDSSFALLNKGKYAETYHLFNQQNNNLGEIQQGYKEFIAALQLFNDFMVNGFFSRRKKTLEEDVISLNNFNELIQKQIKIVEQDLQLSQETHFMNKHLFDEKVLSRGDYIAETSRFINKPLTKYQLESTLLTNETQKREKKKEIEQLNHDMGQQIIIFQQALQTLKSSIDEWKKRFILQAPIGGEISFIVRLQENQFLQQGKLLGYINPEDNRIYAEVNLPQNNFGKIDTLLKVQLRFDAFPYQEVGFVEGTLNYISNIPSDSGFLGNIRLDKGLVTNNNKLIPYKSGLKAQAIIITRNMRLMERFYYNIVKSTSIRNN